MPLYLNLIELNRLLVYQNGVTGHIFCDLHSFKMIQNSALLLLEEVIKQKSFVLNTQGASVVLMPSEKETNLFQLTNFHLLQMTFFFLKKSEMIEWKISHTKHYLRSNDKKKMVRPMKNICFS